MPHPLLRRRAALALPLLAAAPARAQAPAGGRVLLEVAGRIAAFGGVGQGAAFGGVGQGAAFGGVGQGIAAGGVGQGSAFGGVGQGSAAGGGGQGSAFGGIGQGSAAGGVGPGTAAGAVARFDLAALDALPQAGFTTRTPWFDGPRAFSGVSGAGLFAALGATGTEVLATALNDYAVTIPAEDFRRAGLILATRIGGAPIPVREKGPIWILYPFDANPGLRNEVIYSRCIWQLRRLDIRG